MALFLSWCAETWLLCAFNTYVGQCKWTEGFNPIVDLTSVLRVMVTLFSSLWRASLVLSFLYKIDKLCTHNLTSCCRKDKGKKLYSLITFVSRSWMFFKLFLESCQFWNSFEWFKWERNHFTICLCYLCKTWQWSVYTISNLHEISSSILVFLIFVWKKLSHSLNDPIADTYIYRSALFFSQNSLFPILPLHGISYFR